MVIYSKYSGVDKQRELAKLGEEGGERGGEFIIGRAWGNLTEEFTL